METCLLVFYGGARGEAIELDGLPFSKRVFRLPVQHLHGNLSVVLVVVDFIDEALYDGVPHFRVVEVRMEEPVVIGPY